MELLLMSMIWTWTIRPTVVRRSVLNSARVTIKIVPKNNDSKDATKKKTGFSAADAVERDEHRLAELGRKTIEMYVLSRVFNERVEVAFQRSRSSDASRSVDC